MATVILTMRIMPESTETDLAQLEETVKQQIAEFGANFGKAEAKPIAFGLKALEVIFTLDESKGSTENLENSIAALDEVNSAEIIDVRRPFG